MKLSVLVAASVLAVALLVAGCGGSGSGGSSSTAPGGGAAGGAASKGAGGGPAKGTTRGPAKRATAPNAPAGSKVVACGGGPADTVQLRATALGCDTARATMRRWVRNRACTLSKGASRSSCALGGFRCQAVRVDRGAAVSCARPGGDVSFVAKAGTLKPTGAG